MHVQGRGGRLLWGAPGNVGRNPGHLPAGVGPNLTSYAQLSCLSRSWRELWLKIFDGRKTLDTGLGLDMEIFEQANIIWLLAASLQSGGLQKGLGESVLFLAGWSG